MILVTGSTGLLGSHLLFDLVKSGQKVKALKRENSDLNAVKKVFSYYTSDFEYLFNSIQWVEGDILDYNSIIDALNEVEKVYHCAAVVSFNKKSRKEMFKINIEGTQNIVNAALEKGIKKVCYVSSIASLGRTDNKEELEITEQTEWQNSPYNSYYSISKFLAEKEVWRANAEGLNVVIVNPAVIIGPGFWNKGTGSMFSIAKNGFKFYTNGINGIVDVRDVSKSMIMLMESEINNNRFIICSENYSYKDFYDIIAECFGKNKPNIHATPFLSELAWRFFKVSSWFTNKDPLITKETAKTANQKYYYSNKKIKEAININFIPVEQSLKDTSKLFLEDHK